MAVPSVHGERETDMIDAYMDQRRRDAQAAHDEEMDAFAAEEMQRADDRAVCRECGYAAAYGDSTVCDECADALEFRRDQGRYADAFA